MAYYYNDPSGLGSWIVQDGQTPQQAFNQLQQESGATFSPLLVYSVNNTSVAAQTNGGNPGTKQAYTPPPKVTAPVKIYPRSLIVQRPGESIPVDDNGNCPDGYAVDITGYLCILAGTGQPQPGPVGGVSPATANVNIVVNNAVGLSSGIGQAIGDAVNNDVQSAIDATDNAIQGVSSDIQATVDDTTSKVGSLVDSIVNSVKSALNYIWQLIVSNVGTVLSAIKDNIGSLISTVSDTINQVIIPVARDVQQVIGKVNDVLNNTIAPIFNTISQVYQQTNALISAIEKDVSTGITGILQLPSDISSALTSVEAAIQRGIDAIGLKKQDGTSVFLSADGRDSIWDRLQSVGKGVSILGQSEVQGVTYADFVKLSEPDLSRAGAKAIDALVSEVGSFVSDLISGTTRSLDAAKTGITALPLVLGIEAGTWIGFWELLRSLDQLFEPFYKFAKEDLAAKAGLSKLPVSDALAAWRRQLIKDADLTEDLAVNGWDSTRIAVLKDLQQYLLDIDRALDLWHRKVIDETALDDVLRRQGVSGDEMATLKSGSVKLYNVQLAAQASRWGLIDDKALDAVLQENRYTDTELTAFKATMYQQESMDDIIRKERRQILYAGIGNTPEGFAAPSQGALDAAKRDGLSAEVALDHWQDSFFVLPLNEWIEAYFRNILTLSQLNAAMDYYRVPSQQRDLLIGTRRSLIPWRTIPTMLANGIIDQAYASAQLQSHGFDLVATEALLKYAALAKPKSKVVPSADIQGLSIATAKGYFDGGTITADEYKAVLLAHGYDDSSAALAVQVETQHAAMLARKQLAADIVAEAKAGTISVDQAIAQAEAHQFSIAEKSRLLNAINGVKRQTVKRPTEADLHSMAKAGAITLDIYKQTLSADGWAPSWVDAFVNWRFPNAASGTSAA